MSNDIRDWPVASIFREVKKLDMFGTIREMSRLMVEHITHRASFDNNQARYELHPQTRHDLMAAIHEHYGTRELLEATVGGEFKIHGIRVDGNQMLGHDVVRFIGAVTEGAVQRIEAGFEDEGQKP